MISKRIFNECYELLRSQATSTTYLWKSDVTLSRIKFVTYLVILHNKLFYYKEIRFEIVVSCLENQKLRLFFQITEHCVCNVWVWNSLWIMKINPRRNFLGLSASSHGLVIIVSSSTAVVCIIAQIPNCCAKYNCRHRHMVFENHRKSLIQHCQRSELRLHFEWTKVN